MSILLPQSYNKITKYRLNYMQTVLLFLQYSTVHSAPLVNYKLQYLRIPNVHNIIYFDRKPINHDR